MKLCLSCRTPFESTNWTCPHCGAQPPLHDGFICFAPHFAESNKGSPKDVHHYFDSRQERSFWFRGRRRIIQSLVARYCPGVSSFLEVGCGPGYVLAGLRQLFPEAKLVASEIYLHGLPYAARRVSQPVELIQADCLALPYDGEFDAVGAFDVLEHIDREGEAITEMRRALKPSGLIFITVPQHPWLWSRVDEIDEHKRRYRPGELAGRLRDNGFSVLCDTSFVFFLLPALMAQRLAMKCTGSCYPDAEYALPQPIDWLFERLLDVERLAIGLGVRFPMGGSRIVVAQRS